MYQAQIEFGNNSSVVVLNVEGKHGLLGFVLDSLIEHESGRIRISRIEITDVTPEAKPVDFNIRTEEKDDDKHHAPTST